jgi:hypothetical protein
MQELAQDLVRELFDYKDGALHWKQSLNRRIRIGSRAGSLNKQDGRVQVRINGSMYKAHRLVFLWHHGYLPEYIDHIDGNPANNRIENLRECSLSQNQWNRKVCKNNTSGYKGVWFSKQTNKWQVEVHSEGRKYYGGLFADAESANKAAIELRKSLHKDFAKHK